MIMPVWDWGFVAVSVGIAIWASGTALMIAQEPRYWWLGAICLGGGIWAMHFEGMLAYQVPVHVHYEPWTTLLSFLLPVVGCAIGLRLVAGFLHRAPIAGVVIGCSIIGMHYTGMSAMRVSAVVHWDPIWIAISCIIAVTAATAAVLTLFWRPERSFVRALAALLMGIAISGMHYAGMMAFTLTGDGRQEMQEAGRSYIGVAIFIITGVIFAASMVVVQHGQSE